MLTKMEIVALHEEKIRNTRNTISEEKENLKKHLKNINIIEQQIHDMERELSFLKDGDITIGEYIESIEFLFEELKRMEK